MPADHALNLFNPVHTMRGMESSKRSGPVAPPAASSRPSSVRRQSLQQIAIDSQVPGCQQQSQQQ